MPTGTMHGKTVVITGATSGIGQAAAVELARRGADLVLIARNPDKARATTDLIREAVPDSVVTAVPGDLASFTSVRSAAAGVLDAAERIDVLVNNAGIAATHSRTTDDGFDEMLEANYLGPFLLTHLLLDRVRASAPARIVIVGSEAHRLAGTVGAESFEELGTYSSPRGALRAYSRTKLLDIVFAEELARRLRDTGVTVNSLCPGLVATGLARENSSADSLERVALKLRIARTPERGARMTVRLASDPAVVATSGTFFSSTRGAGLLPEVAARRDPALAGRVYERTCELVGVEPLPTEAAPSHIV